MSSSVSKKEDGKGRSRKKDRKREASFLPLSVSAKLARQYNEYMYRRRKDWDVSQYRGKARRTAPFCTTLN